MKDWIIAIMILGFVLLAFVEPAVKAFQAPVEIHDAEGMAE